MARKSGCCLASGSRHDGQQGERDAYFQGLSEIFDFSGEEQALEVSFMIQRVLAAASQQLSDDWVQAEGLQGWTSHIADALLRTPRGATTLHRDKWTMVADSTAEGYGLYAAKKLPAGFVLYAYSAGVERTSAEASRRPNAYQFELKAGKVCDGSNQKVASAARYVNTQGAYAKDNNCLFKKQSTWSQ